VNDKPFRWSEQHQQHYQNNVGCPEHKLAMLEINGTKHYDRCHGDEIPKESSSSKFSFYFNEYGNKLYAFKELSEKIIKLINAGQNFDVEIRMKNKEYVGTSADPYLQTR